MSCELVSVTSTASLIHAMLQALRPGEEVCLDAGLLKHFALSRQTDETGDTGIPAVANASS